LLGLQQLRGCISISVSRSHFISISCFGTYEKAGNRAKWKLGMKTGNGNWKWKQKEHQSLVQCFLHGLMSSVLCHYSLQ